MPLRSSTGLVLAKALAHGLALAPMGWLAWEIWQVFRTGSDALGADPVATIEHTTGLWALRMLLACLAMTPLRQLTGQPVLLRFRRLLGLYAFAWASLHLAAYLLLDLRGYWADIFGQIAKKPWLTVGFAAWLLLVPLAITSTQGWMRRLKRSWGRLHKAIYAIGVLAVLHFWWLVKSDIREPLLYAAILAVLLGWRLARTVLTRRRTAAAPTTTPRAAAPRPAARASGPTSDGPG